jgi:ATP-dependent DNA ligase
MPRTTPQPQTDPLSALRELEPMEAKLVDSVPDQPGWRYEPKWDGFRCLAYRDGARVELKAKSGKPLTRYFPEVAAALAALAPDPFLVDGELVVPVNGAMAFDALQMRLHPAESRVRRLAAETPATFILFDCLAVEDGRSLADRPLTVRRAALEGLFERMGRPPALQLTPYTEDPSVARAWLDNLGSALDGVVCKRADGPYAAGERAMLKVKTIRTADCVVGGFRYQSGSRLVGSLLLGLYDDAGLLHHVGFTSQISDAERPALTQRLEAAQGAPGFTGRAPGGPSRWSTERSGEWTPLKPQLVVEVRFDQVTGERFRHGTRLVRWRLDKAPGQCTLEQLRIQVAATRA